jgi:diamine N-acetyltransferase
MISISQADVSDAYTIATIGAQSFLESHAHSGPAADIDAYVLAKYTVEAVSRELANADNIYHLIYCEGKAAGYSKIVLNSPHALVAAQAVTCLDRLYLLKEFYGLNLGRTLFDHNANIAMQAAQAGIWLYTWIGNDRAIAFYERVGFSVVGNADFRISEHHSNPNHVMYLSFK